MQGEHENSTIVMFDHVVSEMKDGLPAAEGIAMQGFRYQMLPVLLKRFPYPKTAIMSPDFLVRLGFRG